jgi:electron transfer flavoprotein alpha subunit
MVQFLRLELLLQEQINNITDCNLPSQARLSQSATASCTETVDQQPSLDSTHRKGSKQAVKPGRATQEVSSQSTYRSVFTDVRQLQTMKKAVSLVCLAISRAKSNTGCTLLQRSAFLVSGGRGSRSKEQVQGCHGQDSAQQPFGFS